MIEMKLFARLMANEPDSDSDSDSESSDDDDDVNRYLRYLAYIDSRRYLADRSAPIPKTNEHIRLLLTSYKNDRPDIFRSYVRISPPCFDALLSALSRHALFVSGSGSRIPIEIQLSVALFRFGHYGNAASQTKIALWAGIGYGTVDLVT